MDAELLNDPGWWLDERPLAPAGFPGGVPDLPKLAGRVLFTSSGSSGPPKWVSLTKGSLLLSAAAVNAHLDVEVESIWGLALPWHHVGGFGVLARAFEAGCGVVSLTERWDPSGFRAWLQEHGVSHTSLVPTQVHDLVAAGITAPPRLRAVVVGGGRLTTSTGHAARALGWPVLASYGMTEAGSQIATQGLGALAVPYQPDPVPILPHWRLRTGEDDRLEISGPALFDGLLIADGGGWRYQRRDGEWFATSDRATLAGDGLTPLGRLDAVVKVLGELVDPERVCAELLERAGYLLGADSCAVVAVPDARAGHRLVPVFDATVPPDRAAEALEAYQSHAPGFRRLEKPVWVETLPRSPLGKLLRKELTDRIAGETSCRGA